MCVQKLTCDRFSECMCVCVYKRVMGVSGLKKVTELKKRQQKKEEIIVRRQRENDREPETHRNRETERQRHTETESQGDKETGKQRVGKIDRQTDIETERRKYKRDRQKKTNRYCWHIEKERKFDFMWGQVV